jgi:hypothetical protein
MDKSIEYEKTYMRIFLFDEEENMISYNRNDEYETTVDHGYEDLDLKEDAVKISLYQNAEYIELYNDKSYKVIKRVFMPCRPVCLYLYLKEE